MICAGREGQLDRALIESVNVVDNLAGECAVIRLNDVAAMMAGRTLVDKIAPG